MPPTSSFSMADRPCSASSEGVSPAPADLLARLRTGGLQVTNVRIAMLSAMTRLAAPVTLRHLQQQLGPAPVAFASLYRCMLRFEEIALVRRSIGFDGTLRWELNPGTPKEFQVACRNTGECATLDRESATELRNLLEKIERRLRECGYTQLQLNVAFHGIAQPARFGQIASAPRERVA